MKLNERIYKLRTDKKLSQEELANILNVSRQSVSKWETGVSTPDIDKLVELAKVFEISLDELVTGTANIKEVPVEKIVEKEVIKEVEKKTKTKDLVGGILLAVGLIIGILGLFLNLFLSIIGLYIVLMAIILLVVKKNAVELVLVLNSVLYYLFSCLAMGIANPIAYMVDALIIVLEHPEYTSSFIVNGCLSLAYTLYNTFIIWFVLRKSRYQKDIPYLLTGLFTLSMIIWVVRSLINFAEATTFYKIGSIIILLLIVINIVLTVKHYKK